jgi:hypothetical protein
MKRIGCFLLLALVLGVTPSVASDLTLFGGYQKEGKITLRSGASSVQSFQFNPGNFGTLGLRVGIGNKAFGAESTFAYSPNFIDSSAKAIILNENLIVQVPTPVVKPYATAGLGTIITKGNAITDIGAKLAFNYGGGVKVTIAGPVGGRLDVRGYTMPSVQSQTLNVLEVSIGVVFSF